MSLWPSQSVAECGPCRGRLRDESDRGRRRTRIGQHRRPFPACSNPSTDDRSRTRFRMWVVFGGRFRMHRRLFVALAVACATIVSACGSTSTTDRSGSARSSVPTRSAVPRVVSTALGTGVTASTVKLGISLVDFTCIEQFVDSIRVNQQQVYQAYIDDINAKGGINGRKIVPDFKTYCPLSSSSDLNVA